MHSSADVGTFGQKISQYFIPSKTKDCKANTQFTISLLLYLANPLPYI